MCDYTKVSYQCGHVRYLVKAWCVRYQQTQQRCPPNVVATYVTAVSSFGLRWSPLLTCKLIGRLAPMKNAVCRLADYFKDPLHILMALPKNFHAFWTFHRPLQFPGTS